MRYLIISETNLKTLIASVTPKDKSLDGRREFKRLGDSMVKQVIPEGTDSLICIGTNREGMDMKHTIFLGNEDGYT